MYILWNDHHNKSSQHPSPYLVTIFFLVMRNFKVYFLGNFQIFNIVLSIISTLYITSTWLWLNNKKIIAIQNCIVLTSSVICLYAFWYAIICFLKLIFIGVCLLYNAVLASCCRAKWISYICIHRYIYSLFYGFPSHLGHHRALSRLPHAMQRFFLVIHFTYSCAEQ